MSVMADKNLFQVDDQTGYRHENYGNRRRMGAVKASVDQGCSSCRRLVHAESVISTNPA